MNATQIINEKRHCQSWVNENSPMVLTEFFSAENSVSIWNRTPIDNISRYFEQAFDSLGLGIRRVMPIDTLKASIDAILPEYIGKKEAVEDIYLLADMMTCLFNCEAVGLRLEPLQSAMCPSFHVDKIPVRLVNTYLGPGTEWLPVESLYHKEPVNLKGKMSKTNFDMFYEEAHIQQLNAFDVALLKGQTWQKEQQMAAVHRSCQVKTNEKRVLLTLDPM